MTTVSNNRTSALADETIDTEITEDEVQDLAEQIAQERALTTAFTSQPMDVEQFRMMKETARLRSSYTGVKPVSLEDFYNKEIRLRGYYVMDLENTDEETGVVTRWKELRLKLHDTSVIGCSGKGARAFVAELESQGFPQGDWPEEIVVAVHRRKLNSTTKDGAPKYMPTLQIIG